MSFFSHKYFLIICFISLFYFSLSDRTLKTLELEKKVKGKMDENESRECYELKLPSNIPRGSLLVFTVKESRTGIKEGEEIFSDPDIYVSKTNRYPSNKEEASWYSERYGNDILTIPSYEVESNEVFYVCMYCQYKCRFELNSYLSNEAPAEVGKFYEINLSRKSSISYALYVPSNTNEEELTVIAHNPSLKNFRIFMAKESPSSQNTFTIIPSFDGGYAITVSKYSKDYCTDCYYHILFQTEEENVKINFNAFFQSTLTKINSGNVNLDLVKAGSRRCYKYDISSINNIYNSKLMINLNLFSGNVILSLSGWKSVSDNTYQFSRNNPYSYNIDNDKIILLEKKDFENFDNSDSNDNGEPKNLNFCIFGQQMSSYKLSIIFLSEVEKLQRFNQISPGSELTGYLQGGQVTRYKILDFNLNKNSVITLSFTGLQGKVEFFSSFCEDKCEFNDEILKDKIQKGEITLSSEDTGNKKIITIKPEQNRCYKGANNDQKINQCETLAIVKCFGISEDICSYKILPTISDQPIFMSPKKTYYNIIPKGKEDLYEILVTDEEINSIVVVLTSVTGDAELQVERKTDPNENQNNQGFQSKMSRNKDYIPDVVRITPSILGTKNVVGKYIVKITSVSFSSYNLYYYTTRTRPKYEQPNIKDITLSLNEGNIIKDYFPNDISYKIYSYTPDIKEKEDIKIIMTRLNIHFSFKVYLDFNKIVYNFNTEKKYEEKLTNYNWASDQNNELTISKNDKDYSIDGPYYIVVTKDSSYNEYDNEELNQASLMSFYLGVTKKGYPFTLNEGVEQSQTLSEQYNYQNYFYIHTNINNPLNLELNVLSGEIDVFISSKKYSKENLTQIYEQLDKNSNNLNVNNELLISTYMKLGINNYASIELDREYFSKNCKMNLIDDSQDKTCYLYIYVIQSRMSMKYHRDSQYIINVKSSLNTGIILLSGQVYNVKARENKTDHYIIEEVKHRKGMTINLHFKNGAGEIYVRIPNSPESGNNITFPTPNKFDYIGGDSYMGKIVSIPPKVFDRINTNSLKLQILISVVPFSSENSNVEYSITYGSEPKRINQNVPYQSFLKAGEMHYFNFYFDESTENIFISLSNMNGDADMYLNYGNEPLPTINDYNWCSSTIGHEYIDLNIKDPYYKHKNIKSLSGYYSLLVVGYTETTYTLYVSSHPDKIFPLYNNVPMSCQCQIKGEKCFFRYNNVYEDTKTNNIDTNEFIFTTQYIYGNGKMYASIYNEQELTDDSNKKYQDFFPNEKEYHFSNAITGKRNYLKVLIESQKYSQDSLILLTYICEEKTDVEITAASLQYSSVYSFIDPDRENMFYLKYNKSLPYYKQETSTINFFSSVDESLIYEFHAYVGSARITIFTNESIYNDDNDIVKFDYNHIAEFNLRAEKDDENYILRTYTESYFNSIPKKLIYNKNVYFKIRPLSDFGFYIQITYDKSWINLPIGEPKSYLINKDMMYGYFDISPEFSNVEFSLSLDEFIQKKIFVFVKILVREKDTKNINANNEEEKLYHYEIPSREYSDYQGKTDDIIGALNININNLPIIKENERTNKFIRALICIQVEKNQIKKRPKQALIGINNINSAQQHSSTRVKSRNKDELDFDQEIISQTKVSITVTAGINNFKRIDLPQYTYYFSNTSLIQKNEYIPGNNQMKQYDGNKEVKIYSLDKKSNEDRKMVIQMHVCSGKYDMKLSKQIVDYDNNPNDIPISEASDEYGRSKYLIDNLRDKHIYLSIKSAQNPINCVNGKDANGEECSNELSYLIYYYSLTNNEYFSTRQNLVLSSEFVEENENKIKIGLHPLVGMDRNKLLREKKDIEYNLFLTKNENIKNKLDNICYLSRVLSLSDANTFNDTVDNITIVRNIKLNRYNEFFIYSLEKFDIDDKLLVNILARNLKTNELIAYIPLEIEREKHIGTYKKLIISVFIIFLLICIAYTIFVYFKNKVGDGYQDIQFPNKSIEMSSTNSKAGGYQRISLSNTN